MPGAGGSRARLNRSARDGHRVLRGFVLTEEQLSPTPPVLGADWQKGTLRGEESHRWNFVPPRPPTPSPWRSSLLAACPGLLGSQLGTDGLCLYVTALVPPLTVLAVSQGLPLVRRTANTEAGAVQSEFRSAHLSPEPRSRFAVLSHPFFFPAPREAGVARPGSGRC